MRRVVKVAPKKTKTAEPISEDNTTTQTAPPIAAAVATEATPETTDTAVNEGANEAERKMEQRLQETIDELKDFKTMVNGMCKEFIDRLTDAKREIKQLRKTQKKPRPQNVNGPKKQSTFQVPTEISPALCAFLGMPEKSKMSQNGVTHAIHRYCKEQGLLQDGDQRIINPDEALRAVLAEIPDGERLTYFNLQRYLKHNYHRYRE